jgi:hypothetical protein
MSNRGSRLEEDIYSVAWAEEVALDRDISGLSIGSQAAGSKN